MELLLKIFLIFASLFHTEQRHRGELFGFEPSENLENSTCTDKRSESCSPAVAYIQHRGLHPLCVTEYKLLTN